MTAWLRILALIYQRAEQADDLLLPGGGCVKFAPHLGEPVIDPRPEVGQILAHRVEHTRVLFPESTDLCSHLGHVAICATSQDSRGRRVLFTAAYSPV
jgi:hypothetical protein